jgi:hypothetical protein
MQRLASGLESRRYVEQALGAIRSQPEPDARSEMILSAALGSALTYLTGPVPETAAAWARALDLANSLGDADYQLRALRGLWAHRMNAGEFRAALVLADEFCTLAQRQKDLPTLRAGDRVAALILHNLGEQHQARRRIEWNAADDPMAAPPSPSARFMLDQPVAAQALLARILWVAGLSPSRPADGGACTAPRPVSRTCDFPMSCAGSGGVPGRLVAGRSGWRRYVSFRI